MKKIISSTLVVIGFVLGATALSSFAAWTTPTCDPSSNPGLCNVDAPINVGSSAQIKAGSLTLNSASIIDDIGLTITGKIKLDDLRKGAGKVLTDVNGDGVGTWQAAPGSDSSNFCNSVTTSFSTLQNYTLSLMKNGKNICADTEGCTFKSSYRKSDDSNGQVLPDIRMIQNSSTGFWRTSEGIGYTGTQGNGTASSIFSSLSMIAYDDTSPENDANTITIVPNQTANASTVTVCDF